MMVKSRDNWFLLRILVAIAGFIYLFEQSQPFSGGKVAFCILCQLPLLIHLIRKRKAGKKAQPAPITPRATAASASVPSASIPSVRRYTYKVAGTTFTTDGISRQSVLRKMNFGDPPYNDTVEVSLMRTTFEDAPCIAVKVNDFIIGYIPKDKLPEVLPMFDNINPETINIKTYGGSMGDDGHRHSYGAEVSFCLR